MKLVKSLLLGSAAGLSAVAGAQAADLPVRKAAPVEYVRVCSAYGAGFFYIPGTDTCLRVGGRARYEYEFRNQRAIGADLTGTRGLGRLNLDARTQTPYGTLRAFVRFEIAKRSGNGVLRSGTQERFGNAIFGIGVDEFGRNQTQVNIDKAFVQFAGFTAGRAASFFDFYAHDLEIQANGYGSDVSSTNLLAYTATFGSGWSATISIEQPTERRQPFFNTSGGGANGVAGLNTVLGGFGFPVATSGFFPGVTGVSSTATSPIAATFSPVTGLPTSFINLDVTQREKLPDIVGALRVDQAWGSAQLSGAIHELNFGTFTGTGGTIDPVTGAVVLGPNPVVVGVRRPDTEYGFAIQGGAKFNLPMIAAGDVLWLQAAYGDGALSYAGVPSGYVGGELSVGNLTNRFGFLTTDATIDAFGRVHKTEAATGVIAFLHYWTPEWRSAFVGTIAQVNFDSTLRSAFGPAGVAGGVFSAAALPGAFAGTTPVGRATFASLSPLFKDYTSYTGSANLIWSPVKDLDIGVEAFYIRTELDGRVLDQNRPILRNPATGAVLFGAANFTAANITAGFVPKLTNYDDQFVGRVRVQRDF